LHANIVGELDKAHIHAHSVLIRGQKDVYLLLSCWFCHTNKVQALSECVMMIPSEANETGGLWCGQA